MQRYQAIYQDKGTNGKPTTVRVGIGPHPTDRDAFAFAQSTQRTIAGRTLKSVGPWREPEQAKPDAPLTELAVSGSERAEMVEQAVSMAMEDDGYPASPEDVAAVEKAEAAISRAEQRRLDYNAKRRADRAAARLAQAEDRHGSADVGGG